MKLARALADLASQLSESACRFALVGGIAASARFARDEDSVSNVTEAT